MFSPLLTLTLLMGVAQPSFSSFQTFNTIKQISDMENNLEVLETSNRKALQSNKILECDMDDIIKMVGLGELQDLVLAVASRKGVSPFVLLKMLYRRVKNQEEIEENLMNSIDGVPFPDLLSPPIHEIPKPARIPMDANRTPYSLPSDTPNNGDDEETKVVIIPVVPPGPVQNNFPNRLPPVMVPEMKSRNEAPFLINSMRPSVAKTNHVIPAVYPLLSPIRNNHLRPPPGATVRISSGDPMNPMDRDIIVTVSPLMTLVEALRQAEIKYQKILGLNPELDIFEFDHSSVIDCYVLSRVRDVMKSEDFGWKVTVEDRDGQVVYENFCLPEGKEVLVKPGTIISLSYVPF